MTMKFSDQQAAAKLRDLIESISTGVVNRLRPEVRMARVFDFNPATGVAQLLMAGEVYPDVIYARCSPQLFPSRLMRTTYDTLGEAAPCDIVQFEGTAGRYRVVGFSSGLPLHKRYESASVPIGGVIQISQADVPSYVSTDPTSPAPWLNCTKPSLVSPADYPELFSRFGTDYGGNGVDTFGIPMYHAEWPVSSLSSGWFTPAAGWSVSNSNIYLASGNICQFQINGYYNGPTISIGLTGDPPNITVGTISIAKFMPIYQTILVSGANGRMFTGYIAPSTGDVIIAATSPNTDIGTGAGFSLNSVYPVNPPTSQIKVMRAR